MERKMTVYEKQRMKTIEENKAKMKAAGLDEKAYPFKGTIPMSQNEKSKGKKKGGLEDNEELMPFSTDEESSYLSGPDKDKRDEICASKKKSLMTSQGGQGRRQSGRAGQPRDDGRRVDPSPRNLVINAKQSQELEKEIVNDTTYEPEEEIGDGMTCRKRGITCGKGARKAMKAAKKKLPVEFNFDAMEVICENALSFMHECGYILRNNCSLQYKEWRHVPIEVRLPLRHKLTTLFQIDVENSKVCKVIDSYLAKAWRGYKSKLHEDFKQIGGLEDPTKAKTTPPSNVSKEDWEYLCDMWSETKYKENAEKKVKARAQRKINSKNGSKSTIRYHIERGLDLESSAGQIETWRLTHWDAKNGWISTDAAAKYKMMKLRNEHLVESMSDKSIIETVLGRSSLRLHG
ncbi:hypothetical protein HanIR_Chr12g0594831 [Helianthus annuus]|nr:hypothetical protein HanIR_Chr12g0594831 [Helianthus annuus]